MNIYFRKFNLINLKPIVILLLLLMAVPAQAIIITKGFTGLWSQPDQESQGFDFQVIDQNNGRRQAIAYWYTYDTEGNPMWLTGLGDVEGDQVEMELLTVTGVKNLQPNLNSKSRKQEILATATFTFSDCNNGEANIVPKSISGTGGKPNSISGTGGIVRMQRLTQIMGVSCSGGISDDKKPGKPNEENEQFLGNTGVYPDGSAKYHFKERENSTSFEVEIEDTPVGFYDLRVAGIIRGQIEVLNDEKGTEGEIEFESPAEEGEPLLDFDPRGELIEILEGAVVLFSSDFVSEPGPNTDPESVGAPPYGDTETEMDMINTGVYAEASGEIELEQKPDRIEFKVEIEDVPEGDYDLYIDGMLKGVITAEADEDGIEGKIEFEFPADEGDLLLNFDPRGKHIEVRTGAQVILEADF